MSHDVMQILFAVWCMHCTGLYFTHSQTSAAVKGTRTHYNLSDCDGWRAVGASSIPEMSSRVWSV